MSRIIGLRGKKGVGKNFVAGIIDEVLEGHLPRVKVEQGAFAGSLKNFCMNDLGLSQAQCHGSDAEKNSFSQFSWERMRFGRT